MELVDDTYAGRRVVAVYYTSVNRNPRLHCCDCSGLVVQLVPIVVHEISPDTARHTVRLR